MIQESKKQGVETAMCFLLQRFGYLCSCMFILKCSTGSVWSGLCLKTQSVFPRIKLCIWIIPSKDVQARGFWAIYYMCTSVSKCQPLDYLCPWTWLFREHNIHARSALMDKDRETVLVKSFDTKLDSLQREQQQVLRPNRYSLRANPLGLCQPRCIIVYVISSLQWTQSLKSQTGTGACASQEILRIWGFAGKRSDQTFEQVPVVLSVWPPLI